MSDSTDTHSSERTLDELRAGIEEVDHEFAKLLARRQKLALEVAQRKIASGIPLRNYSVESKVMDRFADLCREFGLKERWGIDLANFLISRSVELQSNILEKRRSGGIHRILVIGGLGRMGIWLCDFLNNQGHSVSIHDFMQGDSRFPRVQSLDHDLSQFDIIIISVSMEDTPSVLEKILGKKPKAVVFDVCSMKKKLMPVLKQGVSTGIKVTSIHPLFGPDTATLYGRNIIVCPCGNSEADEMAKSLFSETAANISLIDPEEHDRLMTMTLGLSHAVNLVLADTLAESDKDYSSYTTVGSSTFNKQIATTLEVVNENMDMYFEIQRQCDFNLIYDSLSESVDKIKNLLHRDDHELFVSAMKRNRHFFGDHESDENNGNKLDLA